MSDAAVFLWPLLVALTIAALGSAWQARHPAEEIAARSRLIERDRMAPSWRKMPLWSPYRAQQDNVPRFARAARLRATVLGAGAAAVAGALLLGA